jgi:hypothetical protein
VKAWRLAPTLLVTALVAAGCVSAQREPAAAAANAAKPAPTARPSATTPASAGATPILPRVAPAAASAEPAPAAGTSAVTASPSTLQPAAAVPRPAASDRTLQAPPRQSAVSVPAAATTQAPVAAARQIVPVAPAAAATPAAVPPTLDLKSLEQRLRETRAIGVFTKLALKNQVDDLLDKFRGHHAGKPIPPLPVLKQNFDGLMMKVLALLQNDDPALAKTIATSRNALWDILTDPVKFSNI